MKSAEEIKKAVESLKSMYTPDNMPEYVRGQINALLWVIESDQEAAQC